MMHVSSRLTGKDVQGRSYAAVLLAVVVCISQARADHTGEFGGGLYGAESEAIRLKAAKSGVGLKRRFLTEASR